MCVNRAIARVATLATLLFFCGSVFAAPVPAPPQLAANSYLLVDHISGRVLASRDPDKRVEPASLTKLMTAYLVAAELERGSILADDAVIVSETAQAMPGSRMFIETGKAVTVEELLLGLIVQSGNDASVALAEHVAASEAGFVDMMNRMAQSLGMTSTHFTNASGLPDPEHYTTATDLARLSGAIISNYPEIYAKYSVREYTFNDITQKNRNKLLWRDASVDGMKTGHTDSAGYCLVSSAKRDDMRLISVVMGTASDNARVTESQRLLNYGFRFFRTERVYSAGEVVSEARIWMGQSESIPLGVSEDLYVTLPRDDFAKLKSQIQVSDYIRAPALVGQQFGRSVLSTEEKIIGEVPLMALQPVDEGSMLVRMKHSILRHFQ